MIVLRTSTAGCWHHDQAYPNPPHLTPKIGMGLVFRLLCLLLSTSSSGNAASFPPTAGAGVVSKWVCGVGVQGHTNLPTAPITTETSGSMFLAWVARGRTNAFLPSTHVNDSMQNRYSMIGGAWHDYSPLWPTSGEALFVAANARGGAGHVFNAPMPEDDEITLAVLEVKNGGLVQDAQWNKATAPPLTSRSVTTTAAATLVAIWAGDSGASSGQTARPNNGFTTAVAQLFTECAIQVVIAVKDVQEAGTYDVTWTATPTQGANMWLVAVQATEPPELRAELLSSRLVLSWPGSTTGFGIEATDDLMTEKPWIALTNAPVISNGRYSVNEAPALVKRFYRLRKP